MVFLFQLLLTCVPVVTVILVCYLETTLQQLDHAALCRRAYVKLPTEMEAQELIKNFSGFIFNGKPLDLFFRGKAAFVVRLFFLSGQTKWCVLTHFRGK